MQAPPAVPSGAAHARVTSPAHAPLPPPPAAPSLLPPQEVDERMFSAYLEPQLAQEGAPRCGLPAGRQLGRANQRRFHGCLAAAADR